MELILIIFIWLLCSFVSYGLAYSDLTSTLTSEESYKEAREGALVFSLAGPISLISLLVMLIASLVSGKKKFKDVKFKIL